VLGLFAESLELLDLRDQRRDYRSSAWQFTFTTSMQEQDNPADFRWRCLHSDNPAANRFAGPDCRALSEVRVARVSNEEAIFARSGRQPPRFVLPPQNMSSVAGETARFRVKAEGVPTPAYQWYTADRAGNRQAIAEATSEELVVQNPPLGVTRYAVRASNSQGEVLSDVVMLSVEQKGGGGGRPAMGTPGPARPASGPHVRTEDEIERQRRRLEAEQKNKPRWKGPFFIFGIVFLIGIAGVVVLQQRGPKKPPSMATGQWHETNVELSNLRPLSNVAPKVMPREFSPPNVAETKTEPTTNQKFFPIVRDAKLPWPVEWQQKPIGKVSYAHADCITNSMVFSLSTASEGVRASGDSLFFICRDYTNAEFQASLAWFQSDVRTAGEGIMVRASDSPTASLLFIGVWSGSILVCCRDLKGVLLTTNAVVQKLPVILKLEKWEQQIIAAYSFDHQNWTSFEEYKFPAQTKSLMGFAAWSGDSSNRVTARFVLLPSKEGLAKMN